MTTTSTTNPNAIALARSEGYLKAKGIALRLPLKDADWPSTGIAAWAYFRGLITTDEFERIMRTLLPDFVA